MKSNGNNAPTATAIRARDARDRAAHAHETYRDDYRDGWLDASMVQPNTTTTVRPTRTASRTRGVTL